MSKPQRRKPRQTWLSDDVLVRAPQHGRWAVATIIGLALLGWLSLAAIRVSPVGSWPSWVGTALLGGFIGWGCMAVWKRMRAYKAGWLAGRLQMVRTMREAGERGLSLHEWLDAEFERDAVLMGLPVGPRQERTENTE